MEYAVGSSGDNNAMIFLPTQARQMLGLEQPVKWQHQVLVREGDYIWTDAVASLVTGDLVIREVCGIAPSGRHYLRWAVGKTYAVQSGGGKAIGRTPPIEAIRREPLGKLSDEDCLAEGIIWVVQTSHVCLCECPICCRDYGAPTATDALRAAYACFWNHHPGHDWERDKDEDVWVLCFAREEPE